jgi:hypothetical protein
MPSLFLWGGCANLIPVLIALAGIVFLAIWLPQKTRRDDTMIEVLAMMQQTSEQIDQLVAEQESRLDESDDRQK